MCVFQLILSWTKMKIRIYKGKFVSHSLKHQSCSQVCIFPSLIFPSSIEVEHSSLLSDSTETFQKAQRNTQKGVGDQASLILLVLPRSHFNGSNFYFLICTLTSSFSGGLLPWLVPQNVVNAWPGAVGQPNNSILTSCSSPASKDISLDRWQLPPL